MEEEKWASLGLVPWAEVSLALGCFLALATP